MHVAVGLLVRLADAAIRRAGISRRGCQRVLSRIRNRPPLKSTTAKTIADSLRLARPPVAGAKMVPERGLGGSMDHRTDMIEFAFVSLAVVSFVGLIAGVTVLVIL